MQKTRRVNTFKHLLTWTVLPLIVLVAVAACSPLRTLNVLASAGNGQTLKSGVAYGPLDRHKLDIYTPAASPAAAPPPGGWPLVVFFYGGSWNTGERADYGFVAVRSRRAACSRWWPITGSTLPCATPSS